MSPSYLTTWLDVSMLVRIIESRLYACLILDKEIALVNGKCELLGWILALVYFVRKGNSSRRISEESFFQDFRFYSLQLEFSFLPALLHTSSFIYTSLYFFLAS